MEVLTGFWFWPELKLKLKLKLKRYLFWDELGSKLCSSLLPFVCSWSDLSSSCQRLHHLSPHPPDCRPTLHSSRTGSDPPWTRPLHSTRTGSAHRSHHILNNPHKTGLTSEKHRQAALTGTAQLSLEVLVLPQSPYVSQSVGSMRLCLAAGRFAAFLTLFGRAVLCVCVCTCFHDISGHYVIMHLQYQDTWKEWGHFLHPYLSVHTGMF